MEFLYFNSEEEVRELQKNLERTREYQGIKLYPKTVKVPPISDASSGGRIQVSIDIDSIGPYYMYGVLAKFDFVEDLPTVNFSMLDKSNQGYQITGSEPIPLDLVSNVGKNGNQAFMPYFPLENTFAPSASLELAFQNSADEEVEVTFVLVGYQYFQKLEEI